MGRKLYYYTDINTFKLIIQNGTLRFKQSTSSNDSLDTVHIYDILKNIAQEGIERETKTEPLSFIYKYYDYTNYANSRINAVACFTRKKDSRLLWDAYTMNRAERKCERYNGVCIEFDEDEIKKSITALSNEFDYVGMKDILYGDSKIKIFLNEALKLFLEEYCKLKEEPDQTQDLVPTIYVKFSRNVTELDLKKCIVYPALNLTNYIECAAPLFKHEFWSEEEEVRGVLSIREAKLPESPMQNWNGAYYFYDLPINDDCISKFIVGPEMSIDEIVDLQSIKGKISFTNSKIEKSIGTGVIRSSN